MSIYIKQKFLQVLPASSAPQAVLDYRNKPNPHGFMITHVEKYGLDPEGRYMKSTENGSRDLSNRSGSRNHLVLSTTEMSQVKLAKSSHWIPSQEYSGAGRILRLEQIHHRQGINNIIKTRQCILSISIF
ncbi:unnamed protein product [Adineta ricciae]|uniref:Uncharacterized protein n=1 Tax=Adineta ricciae TaxID=249248 RepID=A0A814UN13_ADIRI|nr:unnamed protein product [Adineta ricciae]